MKFKTLLFAAMAFAMGSTSVVAHHSYAMFDANKTVTVEGTVKKFQWTNPHSWVYLTVTDAGGQATDWAIEAGSPGGLVRQGWTPKTLTPGMKIKVVVHPLLDGKPGGQFMTMTLPDGTQMGDPDARGESAGASASQ